MMQPCVFCAILAGTATGSVVYDDDTVCVIMDIAPVNTGHLLVLPRRHLESLAHLDDALAAHLFVVAKRMARAVRRSGVPCEGINLFLADGAAAFQEVFHLHVHVFPRFAGDTFRIEADWSIRPSREELDAVAARIREADQAHESEEESPGTRR